MRRASVKAEVFRARRLLAAMSLAALIVLALTIAVPAAAQEETTVQSANETTQAVTKNKDSSGEPKQSVQGGGQQVGDATDGGGEQAAGRATDPLQGADVTIESAGGTVENVEIAAADCDVEKGATVAVEDGNSILQTFTNIGDVVAEGAATIEATEDQILVTDIEDELNSDFGTSDTGSVTDSTGIACGRDADGGNNAVGDENGNDAGDDEDLRDLGCDELLVLFRSESSSGQQYRDASSFADSEVRARVEVCLEREIVKGTAADEDLPDTGGLSLVGLGVLGAVSAAAGLSLIRGGRR